MMGKQYKSIYSVIYKKLLSNTALHKPQAESLAKRITTKLYTIFDIVLIEKPVVVEKPKEKIINVLDWQKKNE